MSTQTDDHPCQPCGACCSHFRVSFYHGELDDMPFGMVPVALTEKLNDTRACMKGTSQKQPRCIALSGTPGQFTACTIYAQRPTPCREFNAWDDNGQPNADCQRLRAGLGLAALAPLRPA